MLTDLLAKILGDGNETPGNYQGTIANITHATIREVDFSINTTNKLSFTFSRGRDVTLSSTLSILEVLRKVYKQPGSILTVPATPSVLNPEEDPVLSIRHGKLGYVIYRLSDKNWQFSRIGPPITISKDTKESGHFVQARRVFCSASGVITGDKQGLPGHERSGCKVAYLIVDADNAKDKTTDSYDAGINLNVELVSDETPPRYTPFTIDPDIRYPGGSVADPLP